MVAVLFGRGADGPTCACDAAGDGVTNPAPINGNTGVSLNADDDGGYFKQQAAELLQQRAARCLDPLESGRDHHDTNVVTGAPPMARCSASQVSPRKWRYCSARNRSARRPSGNSTSSYVMTLSFGD